ncbi:hypothetical protein ASE26_23910 [Duganella sp. Root198D2]|nr:hypothetical protein ASD07_11225 [Duganella sp. Root336D2]KRC00078.1 hypothetical protein ASE26_23910 [Duganella sp. Root198D2]
MPLLNRDEFTTALHQGRGSAVLHVQDHGSDELFEIILDACLVNRAYDQQCEGPRAKWLYSMIAHDDRICAAVIEAFKAPVEDQDLFQVANLVGLIAVNGSRAAAEALRRSWAENDLAGELAIIMLDGVPAAIEVVRCLGQRLISDPDEYVDGLEFLVEDEALREQVLLDLSARAPGDMAITAYLAMHQEQSDKRAADEALSPEQKEKRRLEYQRKHLAENPLSRIVELAQSQDKVSPHIFRRFGRWASDSERQKILQILESELAPQVQIRLLHIFGRGDLRAWNDTVWNLAHSPDQEVRLAAVKALASLEDTRVGELARRRLSEEDFSVDRRDEIELLKKNFLPGDEKIIISALERVKTDADGMHFMEMPALHVCQENPDARLAGIASFIYRTNPCSLCRRDIVEWMKDVDCLPAWIANEARFDASEETRILLAGANAGGLEM